MKFSRFPKTKLTPGQLFKVVEQYCDSVNLSPFSVDDIAGTCGAGRYQVYSVCKKM